MKTRQKMSTAAFQTILTALDILLPPGHRLPTTWYLFQQSLRASLTDVTAGTEFGVRHMCGNTDCDHLFEKQQGSKEQRCPREGCRELRYKCALGDIIEPLHNRVVSADMFIAVNGNLPDRSACCLLQLIIVACAVGANYRGVDPGLLAIWLSSVSAAPCHV